MNIEPAKLAKLKQKLLLRPELINVRQAAIRLLARKHGSENMAESHLDQLQVWRVIADMFRVILPKEYAAVARKNYYDQGKAFFDVLGFACNTDYYFYELVMDGQHPVDYPIPLHGENPFDIDEDFQWLSPTCQLALIFYRPRDMTRKEHDPTEDNRRWGVMVKAYQVPERLRPKGTVDMSIYVEACKALTSPLRHLPDLFRMMEYNTGCFFFDFDGSEYLPEIDWTTSNIHWLREEWKKAEVLDANLHQISKWLKGKYASKHFADACRLYHQVRKLTDEAQKDRSRSSTGPGPKDDAPGKGKALVGIL